jgi:hypothetical protein
MKITVQTQKDWLAIAQLEGPVVDPMILRSGEIFLRGAAGARDPSAAWEFLAMNLHAVGTFFDRLILDERIPVFNYSDSFDLGQNFDQRTLSYVNSDGEILVDVDVDYGTYHEVKRAAVAELEKLYAGGSGVDAQEAYNILGELSASGYAWYPHLGDLVLANEQEKRLAAYILGGLIFGAYAQASGADHLMQPKRSRLFLALSLRRSTARTAEEILFSKLGELLGRPVADVPYTPTFLPLLLAHASGPADVLGLALELRKSGEVRDYRSWLLAALTDFDANGRITIERTREVEAIERAIRRRLAGLPLPSVEIKTTVAAIAGGALPAPGLDLGKPMAAAWGWLVSQIPGRRHRKLLTRAVIADREYVEIDRRLRTVWSGAGVPA